jgi:hypothetical protein
MLVINEMESFECKLLGTSVSTACIGYQAGRLEWKTAQGDDS